MECARPKSAPTSPGTTGSSKQLCHLPRCILAAVRWSSAVPVAIGQWAPSCGAGSPSRQEQHSASLTQRPRPRVCQSAKPRAAQEEGGAHPRVPEHSRIPRAANTLDSSGAWARTTARRQLYVCVSVAPSTSDTPMTREASCIAQPQPHLLATEPVPHPTAPHPTAPHPTAPHPSAPHPTAPHPSAPHPTAPHPTAPHPTAPHPTAPHPTAPHPTAPHPTAPHPTAPHPTVPHPTVPHSSPCAASPTGRQKRMVPSSPADAYPCTGRRRRRDRCQPAA
jgi:hypothetical protein